MSEEDVHAAVIHEYARLFGRGQLCGAGSLVFGDLDGDLHDDAVVELSCSDSSVGQERRDGFAVFLNRPGRGITLASVERRLPPDGKTSLDLDGICDGVLIATASVVGDASFGSQAASYTVRFQLGRNARLRTVAAQ